MTNIQNNIICTDCGTEFDDTREASSHTEETCLYLQNHEVRSFRVELAFSLELPKGMTVVAADLPALIQEHRDTLHIHSATNIPSKLTHAQQMERDHPGEAWRGASYYSNGEH